MRGKLRGGGGLKISFFAFQDIITSVTGILILVTLILTMYLKPSAEPAPLAAPSQTTFQLEAELKKAQQESLMVQQQLDHIRDLPPAAETAAKTEELTKEIAKTEHQLNQLQQNIAQTQNSAAQDPFGIQKLRQELSRVEAGIAATNAVLDDTRVRLAATNAQLTEAQAELSKAQANTDIIKLIPGTSSDGKEPVIVIVSGSSVSGQPFALGAAERVFPSASLSVDFPNVLANYNPARHSVLFYVRPSGIKAFQHARQIAKSAGFAVGYDLLEENKQLQIAPPK